MHNPNIDIQEDMKSRQKSCGNGTKTKITLPDAPSTEYYIDNRTGFRFVFRSVF